MENTNNSSIIIICPIIMSNKNLKIYESVLRKNNKSIFLWSKNKIAVMIVSGGLDSSITWARLIREYDMEIFPLHINRGQKNYLAESNSLKKISEILSKQFPEKFHNVETVVCNVPPKKIKDHLQEYMKKNGYPFRDNILLMIGVQYAISLNEKLGIRIKTILSATVPDDPFPHCNLSSFRALNMLVCQSLNDWSWLITSPNIDKKIFKKKLFKIDEIRWAQNNQFPTELTTSCYKAKNKKIYHCGSCFACTRRKEAFKMANVEDKTKYRI